MSILLVASDAEIIRSVKTITLDNVSISRTASEALEFLLDDNVVELIICQKSKDMNIIFKYMASSDSKTPILIITTDNSFSFLFPQLNLLGALSPVDIVYKLPSFIEKLNDKSEASTNGYGFQRFDRKIIEGLFPFEFDVFLRTSDNKFIAVFKSGSEVSKSELLQVLNNQNVQFLYLRNEDANKVVTKVTGQLVDIHSSKVVLPSKEALGIAQNIQETVIGLSKIFGFTDEIRELSKTNVHCTVKAIASNSKGYNLLSSLTVEEKKEIRNKGVILAHIACGLANQLQWTSENTFLKLTIASFFHDYTLDEKFIPILKDLEDPIKFQKLSKEDQELFRTHPETASVFINQFQEQIPGAEQLILQHHELPEGNGYPNKIKGREIPQISALFIIAHDFINFIEKNHAKTPTLAQFLDVNKERYDIGNFRIIYKRLSKIKLTEAA